MWKVSLLRSSYSAAGTSRRSFGSFPRVEQPSARSGEKTCPAGPVDRRLDGNRRFDSPAWLRARGLVLPRDGKISRTFLRTQRYSDFERLLASISPQTHDRRC
jgi:hypothetical protein